MKKIIVAVFSAVFMILIFPAADVHAEGNVLYLKTENPPAEAVSYAREMFSGIPKSDLVCDGVTLAEAKKAVLGEGFCAKYVDGENGFYICHFPVMSGGRILPMLMTVNNYGGSWSFQFGEDNMAAALNGLVTSYDDPAEIYVSDNAYYGVTDNNVTVLSYGIPCNLNMVEEEKDILTNRRKTENSPTDKIAIYGNPDKGFMKKNGRLVFVNSDGSYAKGWQTVGGKKYFFDKKGFAAVKPCNINGVRYDFAADGECLGKYSGWQKMSGKYYYYKDGAVKKNSWITENGRKYYLTADGSRAVGKTVIDGKTYSFSSSGELEESDT